MYADLTDIWSRYRVISATITITAFPTSASSTPLFVIGHPYRTPTSSVSSLSALSALPDNRCHANPVVSGPPLVTKHKILLSEAYKLLNDNTENGLEGPTTWAAATHQWDKIPTYQPYYLIAVANSYLAAASTNWALNVRIDYECELSERQPFNTTS